MNILILNPAFPKDKSKARALTKEQFDHVHDYIVECMNSRKPPKDEVIVDMLEKANMPIDFTIQVFCKDCKKEIKYAEVEGRFRQWKAVEDTDQSMAQYCWADPVGGSRLHEPQR